MLTMILAVALVLAIGVALYILLMAAQSSLVPTTGLGIIVFYVVYLVAITVITISIWQIFSGGQEFLNNVLTGVGIVAAVVWVATLPVTSKSKQRKWQAKLGNIVGLLAFLAILAQFVLIPFASSLT